MEEDLKQILEKNSQDVAEIKKMVKGIKNHFIRQEIYQWLIIILFVAPVIIAGFMLWPTLVNLSDQIQQILSNGLGAITGSDLNSIK
jgi:hypothetical protein